MTDDDSTQRILEELRRVFDGQIELQETRNARAMQLLGFLLSLGTLTIAFVSFLVGDDTVETERIVAFALGNSYVFASLSFFGLSLLLAIVSFSPVQRDSAQPRALKQIANDERFREKRILRYYARRIRRIEARNVMRSFLFRISVVSLVLGFLFVLLSIFESYSTRFRDVVVVGAIGRVASYDGVVSVLTIAILGLYSSRGVYRVYREYAEMYYVPLLYRNAGEIELAVERLDGKATSGIVGRSGCVEGERNPELSLETGERVVVKITNPGGGLHSLVVEDSNGDEFAESSEVKTEGATAEIVFEAKARLDGGRYYCYYHEDEGGRIAVTDAE